MGKKGKSITKELPKDGKKAKIPVSAILGCMDTKPELSSKKAKLKPAKEDSSYTDDIDYPPSDDESDSGEEQQRKHRAKVKQLDLSLSDKELKKREQKKLFADHAAAQAKKEALMDDRDAFTVVIGRRASALEGGEDGADANVKDISISSFSVSVRGKELLKNASVKISHGKKYGLVGPNGMGKSTLLKLLAWRKIPVPKNIDVLLVEQEVVGDDQSALEAVVSADEKLLKIRQEVDSLQSLASENKEDDVAVDDDSGEKLAELYERLRTMGSDAAESQASIILAGLGFTKEMQHLATRSFSGGWRMRISLARALFVQPTLLLLDEPTNHLDLRAGLWLAEFLCQWEKTLVIVSHRSDFLNSVCDEIIHLHDLKLDFYRGNFDDFERGYGQRRTEMNKKIKINEKLMKTAKKYGKEISDLTISKNKAKGKVADEDAQQETPKKLNDYSVKFHFPNPTHKLSSRLLQLIGVSFTYTNRDDFKLSNIDLCIDMGTRMAIVGSNGAGKSTLLNLLAGDLVPTEGEARKSHSLKICRYSQHFVDILTMEETPVQYLLRLYPDQEGCSKQEPVRAMLGRNGLPSHNHHTPIAKLSGGQKARVVFTSICMSSPDILLLDEPTNHLDKESIDALALALEDFTGGVVLVSHEPRLMSRVCENEEKSQILVVGDGNVISYAGNFDEYKEELQKEHKAEIDKLKLSGFFQKLS